MSIVAPTVSLTAVFVLLLLAPLLEELVFRAGLHAWALQRWRGQVDRWRPWRSRSNLLVAVCFAAAHAARLQPLLALATVLPALCIGQLYERTNRLWPCVLMHAAFNLCGLVLFTRVAPW